MSNIQYTQLIDLLNDNQNSIEQIKDQYLLLLSELTSTSFIETSLFLKNIERISEIGAIIVGVIMDSSNSYIDIEIIASGSIIIEPKIIRGGKNVGHIEDIIVNKHFRGKGISQKILDSLKLIAREKNCYKVIVDCCETVKKVYIKNGFSVKGIQMAEYF
jgi:glucosamine-phosphate N-acetyltransferase